MTILTLSFSLLALLAAGTEAAHIERRAPPPPAICGTLNSCYSRFAQAPTASAYCSAFLPLPGTKTITTLTTLPASTNVVTKIITIKGTTTIPRTQTIINSIASFVTSYQSCTTAATLAASSPPVSSPPASAFKRQASGSSSAAPIASPVAIPGCLQYLLGTAPAATSTGCSCIVTPTTPTFTFSKTVTPKVSTYTWTGTVSLASYVPPHFVTSHDMLTLHASTIQYTTFVTVTPTLTVTMDALPCSLTVTTTPSSAIPVPTTSSTTSSGSTSTPLSSSTSTPLSSSTSTPLSSSTSTLTSTSASTSIFTPPFSTLPSSTSSSTSTSSSALPSSSSSSLCPGGGTYTSPDGSTFRVECNTDRGGSDADYTWTPTFEECSLLCAARGSDCAAMSFVPNITNDANCWIKNVVPAITSPTYVVHSLVRLTSSSSAQAAGPRGIECEDYDETTYTTGDGTGFGVSCANTAQGTVLSQVYHVSSLQVCADGCEAYGLGKGCAAAVYDYAGRSCSYYGADVTSVPTSSYSIGTVFKRK